MEAHAFCCRLIWIPLNPPPTITHISYLPPEMEFLYISLMKDWSLLFCAIHTKKNPRNKKFESIYEQHFVGQKNERRILESEKTRVYAQKPRLKMQFKNSISGLLKSMYKVKSAFES